MVYQDFLWELELEKIIHNWYNNIMRVPSFEDFIGLLTIEDIDKLTRLVSEHITDNETKKEYEPLISKLKRSRAELAEILQK